MARARTVAETAAFSGAYVAALLWLTWPLAGGLGTTLSATSFPCYSDALYSAWALAHETHALVTAPSRFPEGNIYYPTAHALFYGQTALGALPFFAPTFLVSGNPTLALNVTFLGGLALTGTVLFAVVRRWTGSALAGAVAAMTILPNEWLLRQFVPSAPHWAALELFPLVVFVAARSPLGWSAALALVPILVLQCLTDLVYVLPAVLVPLALLVVLRTIRRESRTAGLRLAVALGISVVALLPLIAGHLVVRAANPELARQTTWQITEASFPRPISALGGAMHDAATPALAALLAAGVVAAVVRRARGREPVAPGAWANGWLWTATGFLLALPPWVLIGRTIVSTPLAWVDPWLHLVETMRVPSRLGVAGLFGLAVLAGVAFAEVAAAIRALLAARVPRLVGTGIVAGLAVAFALGHEPRLLAPPARPVFQPPTAPPGFVPLLTAAQKPVVELPLGKETGPPHEHAKAMYRSIGYWWPLLNGYSSYWPAAFPARMALAARLPAPDALHELVASTGLGFVWVHAASLSPAARAVWTSPPDAGAERLQLVARDGSEWLFAVVPAPRVD